MYCVSSTKEEILYRVDIDSQTVENQRGTPNKEPSSSWEQIGLFKQHCRNTRKRGRAMCCDRNVNI